MNLINNRYRVIKYISQDMIKSSYLVSDVLNNHEKMQLNIINSQFASKNMIDFFTDEFTTFVTIKHANISKVFDFGLVYNIDNKKMNNVDYFFTNQYVENISDFHELTTNINEDDILDIFIQICKAINYLHLRGFVHGELNTKNLMISHVDNEYKILFVDIPTLEIQKQKPGDNNVGQLTFKAPESITENIKSIASDIYSMGVLLLALCKIDVSEKESVGKSILRLKERIKQLSSSSEDMFFFYNNIIKIIEKMTNGNARNRYENVNELVKDINIIFNTEYKAYIIDEIEKLNFNMKIVGRELEIDQVMNSYEDLIQYNLSTPFILVHGEQGIGKTKFLKEIENKLLMKKANVYSSFIIENSNNNKAIVDILKKIVAICDKDIIKAYQSELIKFIPELGEVNNIKSLESLSAEKEKYRLISRIYSFIKEFVNNRPVIFIIDNANYLDDFSMELLEYISAQTYIDQNIMIVLSYSDGEYGEYTPNRRFYKFVNKTYNNINLALSCLNNDETAIMIQKMLSMPRVPSEFGKAIYDKTYGNPLFVEETLKDFTAKKIICVNENSGRWYTPLDTFDEMPIASNMEQALLNQIKDINEERYEILSTISIFNTAVSIGLIEKFFVDDEKKIEKNIDELCLKGILCKKIEDRGFVFDFNNKVLKNLIYNRLSEIKLKEKHEIAVLAIESLFEAEGRENKEELIYHLEKAGDKNKAAKYCIEIAEKMERFRLMNEAITQYEKAFSMISDEKDVNTKVKFLHKIGDIYTNVGNLPLALETYKKVYRYKIDQLEEKLQVDTYNKIAHIYIKKNDMEKALEYIKKGEGALIGIEYMLGYLENKKSLAYIYLASQEYDKTFEICTSCIKLCGNDYIKYKGMMCNFLGGMYSETCRLTEALEAFEQGLKYFEEVNYIEGMSRCLNNIGVIFGDHYQDNEKAIGYYNKLKEISEENNLLELQVIALTNLATCYTDNFDYDTASKYFKNALEQSKNMELESNIFYIYNYLSYVSLKIGDNEDAYVYYELAKKELEQYPIQGKEISLHYQMGAELSYGIGDIEGAYNLTKKAADLYNNDGTTQDNNCKLLLLILEIHRAKDLDDIYKSMEKINIIVDGYKSYINKINALYEICIVLCDKGYFEQAMWLFESNTLSNDDISADIVKMKELYFKALIYKYKDKNINLMEALELSKKTKNKFYQWRVCCAIGDYYFEEREYFYAVNYYFEACEIIKDCTMQLPEKLRVNYINAYNMIKPFNIIKGMSKTYTYTKMYSLEENRIIISNLDNLEMLFNYDNFSEILNNKSFIESAKKIYSSKLPKGMNDINDIVTNMCDDPLTILEVITKLISSIVLSTRSLIISESTNSEYSVIATSDGNDDIADIKLVLERVKETKKSILINEGFNNIKNVELRAMSKGIKSIICIPIIRKDHCCMCEDSNDKNERANESFKLENIKGYLYMESERVFNNFNENGLDKCRDLIPFISFIMENYLLKISSSIDKLTGTLTRRFLEEALSENIERANNAQGTFSIIMFDLDDFKGVNDRFGHQTGDKVLQDVSKIVKESIRSNDVCGRYGGEEFIVILPGTDTVMASEIAEKIRCNIESKKILGTRRELTVSMGIASYPTHGKWKLELVEKADQALYVAKANGKNRCQIWEEEFLGKVTGTNRLSGIVSGNSVQDSRNVLAMLELLDIIKEECDLETKIYNSLGRIIETTEAQNGVLFIVNENKIAKKFGRRIFSENWTEAKGYSNSIVESVLIDKQGICMIDWDCVTDYDLVSGIPNWYSVLAVPLIKAGVIMGILYLTVPIKVKEFKFQDLNFVNTLGQLMVGLL
jgi:diguanylate cyclase (GGDEF)-like protein